MAQPCLSRARRLVTHPSLDHAQRDHALVELLLGKVHLHGAVAGVAIGLLQRLQRALHVAEVTLLAAIGRERALDRALAEQRIALDTVPRDIETQRERRFLLRPGRARRRRTPPPPSRPGESVSCGLPLSFCGARAAGTDPWHKTGRV
jgi:hypothetical protein